MLETVENIVKNTMITCNDTCNELCNEGINTPIICNDSNIKKLEKSDWWYLVQTLESWGVFKPRAIIKKDPLAAWKCMNLAKDNQAKSKGAYFMSCFKRELAKNDARNFIKELESRLGA